MPKKPIHPGEILKDELEAMEMSASALARAIRRRLGPTDFAAYVGLLCTPTLPAWQTPLRERWYFSDWDMNWLAEQIRPKE